MNILYFISSYGQDCTWIKEYTNNFIIWEQHEIIENIMPHKKVPHIGSDLRDKFGWIIENYENLPDVVFMIKANLFKYITKAEFDKVKDNTIFTPLLTQGHPEIMTDENILKQQGWEAPKPFSFYKDGMYYELNYPAYLKHHHLKDSQYEYADTYLENPLLKLLGIDKMEYIPFAPGSSYILTRENILQNSKAFYEELRSYLAWDRYPGESMICERGLYNIWKPRYN